MVTKLTGRKVPNLYVLPINGFRENFMSSHRIPPGGCINISVVYSKCYGMCRSKTSVVNQEQDSLLLGFLSAQLCCRGAQSASRVYRVDFSCYHFISSSSVALSRGAVSVGFSSVTLLLIILCSFKCGVCLFFHVVCVSMKTYLLSFH